MICKWLFDDTNSVIWCTLSIFGFLTRNRQIGVPKMILILYDMSWFFVYFVNYDFFVCFLLHQNPWAVPKSSSFPTRPTGNYFLFFRFFLRSHLRSPIFLTVFVSVPPHFNVLQTSLDDVKSMGLLSDVQLLNFLRSNVLVRSGPYLFYKIRYDLRV